MSIPEVIEVNLPPGSVGKAATQVGISLDPDQLKNLEDEMSVRNEIIAKQMKEIEMSKQILLERQESLKQSHHQQPLSQRSNSMTPSFSEKPHQLHKMNSFSQSTIVNDENASIKAPSAVKKVKVCENSVMPLGKSSTNTLSQVKPLRKPTTAFAESTSHSNHVVQ